LNGNLCSIANLNFTQDCSTVISENLKLVITMLTLKGLNGVISYYFENFVQNLKDFSANPQTNSIIQYSPAFLEIGNSGN